MSYDDDNEIVMLNAPYNKRIDPKVDAALEYIVGKYAEGRGRISKSVENISELLESKDEN